MSFIRTLLVFAACFTLAREIPLQLPDPASTPPKSDKPVKVYILSGQSNMVGIGQVNSGGTRWSGVIAAEVSVYPGPYSASADYAAMTPTTTKKLPVYGGTKPTPFPGGGVQVSRGFITLKESGLYRFNPSRPTGPRLCRRLVLTPTSAPKP